jgi:hypothetical protein
MRRLHVRRGTRIVDLAFVGKSDQRLVCRWVAGGPAAHHLGEHGVAVDAVRLGGRLDRGIENRQVLPEFRTTR